MPYHQWEDKSFDWEGLYKAESFIYDYVESKTGCHLSCKEKYGSVRYERILPPKWVYKIAKALHVIQRIIPGMSTESSNVPGYRRPRIYFHNNFIEKWYIKRGWKATKKAVFIAIDKWPHLKNELLCDLAARVDLVGKEIHDQYWIEYVND